MLALLTRWKRPEGRVASWGAWLGRMTHRPGNGMAMMCRETPATHVAPAVQPGHVYLVGAGAGHADLLTLRAAGFSRGEPAKPAIAAR